MSDLFSWWGADVSITLNFGSCPPDPCDYSPPPECEPEPDPCDYTPPCEPDPDPCEPTPPTAKVKGNEGLGNFEDPPPPGHVGRIAYNDQNDEPANPGQPQFKGGPRFR
jgi:hypothetical protein